MCPTHMNLKKEQFVLQGSKRFITKISGLFVIIETKEEQGEEILEYTPTTNG